MLNATAIRARTSATADLNLSELSCIRHVVIEPDKAQRLLVNTTDKSVAIVLRGDAILSTPVNVKFHVDGVAQSATVGARTGPWRPAIPIDGDHPFQSMTTTGSDRWRPGCG